MRLACLAVLIVVGLACGSAPAPSGTNVGTITLEVSGGIAGWDRVLYVDPDGTARVQALAGPSPSGAPPRVDADVLARLHELVSDPAFARLAPVYLPPRPGADLQDYTVTAEVEGKKIKATVREGATPPPNLAEVLAILKRILADAQDG